MLAGESKPSYLNVPCRWSEVSKMHSLKEMLTNGKKKGGQFRGEVFLKTV
jgi:hypothetical protein